MSGPWGEAIIGRACGRISGIVPFEIPATVPGVTVTGGQSFVQSSTLAQPLTHSSTFFGPTSRGQGLVLPLTSPGSLPHTYLGWDSLILVWKVKVAEQWLSCRAMIFRRSQVLYGGVPLWLSP